MSSKHITVEEYVLHMTEKVFHKITSTQWTPSTREAIWTDSSFSIQLKLQQRPSSWAISTLRWVLQWIKICCGLFFTIITSHRKITGLMEVISYWNLRNCKIDALPWNYNIWKFHVNLLRLLFTSLRGLFYFFLQFQHKFLFA